MIPGADRPNHISNGSVLISRRRDILYGSFRTSMKVPDSWMGGSALEMSARFNESESVTIGLFAANYNASNNNYRWSYSASGHPAAPVISNLTSLGDDKALGFNEHRFDWARYPGVSFGNDAQVGNFSQSDVFTGGRNKHIPSTPATFSLRHYANGETSQSAGPPIGATSHGQVLYTRMFFNSSVAARQVAFEQECLQTAEAICSTEDFTLRGSTPFDVHASLQRYVYVPAPFHSKKWALILFSTLLGISAALTAHALARRVYARHVRYAQYDREQSTRANSQTSSFVAQSDYASEHKSEGAGSAWTAPPILLSEQPWMTREKDDDEESEMDKYDWSEGEDDLDWTDYDIDTPHHIKRQSDEIPLTTMSSRPSFITHNTNQTTLSLVSNVNPQSHSTSLAIWDTPVRKWLPKKKATTASSGDRHNVGATVAAEDVQLAEATDRIDFVQQRPPSTGQIVRSFGSRLHDMLFVTDKELGVTADGGSKMSYISSLRGFAAILITFGHFVTIFDRIPLHVETLQSDDYSGHYPDRVYYLYKICFAFIIGGSASYRVAMFFVLPARILGTRYLAKGGLQNLADKSIRILIRLVFAVACISLFEYFLFDVNAFRWIERVPSRTWTTWSYAESYKNIGEYVNSMISLWYTAPPVAPAITQRYAIGIMWTMPLMLQLNFTLFLCAVIAREIKNHYKRYAFYFCCLGVTYYSGKLDFLFILGLVVADLDVKLNYRKHLANGIAMVPRAIEEKFRIPRIPGQIVGWIVFLTGFGLFWSEVTGLGPAAGLSRAEQKIRPDFETGNPVGWSEPDRTLRYNDLKLTCFLPVLGFYLLCDLSKPFEKFFRLRFLRTLGKHLFGIFVLHGAVFWSVGSFVMVKLLANGVPYWAAELSTFVVSYPVVMLAAVIFTYTIDAWSSRLSVAAWRLVTRGYGRRDV